MPADPVTDMPLGVLLLGGSGTAGQATARALVASGHRVTCVLRDPASARVLPAGVTTIAADVTDAAALHGIMKDAGLDAVVSCLASRSGSPRDAWTIDHGAHGGALAAAKAAGIGRFVLLSAICVQKPLLEFQRAKLAFEAELQASGLTWSIVRPTAFFKSLSGQIGRLRAGKPFLLFGDGTLTACKPIGDDDLGRFVADCLTDPERERRVLPVGGPGPALTPRQQGEALFAALGRAPKFRQVPVALMDAIIGTSGLLGRVSATWADRAEFARIGRYYATESMLVWDAAAGRYDADATPEFGTETLADHYRKLVAGGADAGLGDHAVF
ncbi:NAD(P)H-binding protein [Roseibacterium sp. SDUM158017]|uniref:NAD(P)H-binding protein n=1 Tax=Roseicyclus salinarum TaxID=3036773 RepID=UPI00241592FE|nr:NAD(P)H-binding protein [Roseibacterium sp. SDUM158017]MDG4649453.1 NAD(P)H-binding protein [Roseibacterium sp. SDUM158017]